MEPAIAGLPVWAVFIANKMPKAFTYMIIDELHEQKSDSSGQATACGKLISPTRYCLGMTGTLIGGYPNHLFPLLFRTSGERIWEEGFEWAKDLAFTERYGRIERTVTTKESAGELSLTTSNRSMRRDRSGRSGRRRPVPGVMPALFGRHLIDKAIFLALEDMADNLPRLREYVGGPPQPDYDDGDHRFHIDCRVSMAPERSEGRPCWPFDTADQFVETVAPGSRPPGRWGRRGTMDCADGSEPSGVRNPRRTGNVIVRDAVHFSWSCDRA